MRIFSVMLLIFVALLQYRLWYGNNGINDYFALRAKIHAENINNDQQRIRNQVLHAEIENLRTKTEALEERARNELGMVKQGETFYRVVNKEPMRTQ